MKDKNYNKFKRRLINENFLDNRAPDKIYSLSREHIELTLGIRLPLLLETVDYKTEQRIFRQQYLFEQFMQSLRNAASQVVGQTKQSVTGAVNQAGQKASNVITAVKTATPTGVYQAAKGAVQNVVQGQLQKVKDAAGIFRALGLIFQYPTLVKEFGQTVSGQVTQLITPINNFLGQVIQYLKTKTEKVWEYIKSTFNRASTGLTNIIAKFRGLQGWTKAICGLGLLISFKWVWDKASDKIKNLLPLFQKADDMKKDIQKKIKEELNSLAKDIIGKIFGQAALAALSSFTGPIATFLNGISKFVGGIQFIVDTIVPVTNKFIEKYNQIIGKNHPAVAPSVRAADLQQTTTQKAGQAVGRFFGIREQKMLLADILF